MKSAVVFLGLVAVVGVVNGYYAQTGRQLANNQFMSMMPFLLGQGNFNSPLMMMAMMRRMGGTPAGQDSFTRMMMMKQMMRLMGEAGPAMAMLFAQQGQTGGGMLGGMDPLMMSLLFQGNDKMMNMLPFMYMNQQRTQQQQHQAQQYQAQQKQAQIPVLP